MIAQPHDSRPIPLAVDPDGLPEGLPPSGYVAWRYQFINGRWTKPPIDTAGRRIDTTNPATWRTLPDALAQVEESRADGIGIATDAVLDLAALDLDHCLDDAGEPLPWAEEIIETFPTHWEPSPGRKGLRALFWADTAMLRNWKHTRPDGSAIELHVRGGFVTLTGQRLAGTSPTIERCQEAAEALQARLKPAEPARRPDQSITAPTALLSDDDVLTKAYTAKNGAQIRALAEGDDRGYDDDTSRADEGTATALAFWCSGPEQLERVMDQLPRCQRPKWRDRPDYRRRTCARAWQTCTRRYEPAAHPPLSAAAPEHGRAQEGELGTSPPAGDAYAPQLAAALAENARLRQENETLRADNRALVQLITNPHIRPTEKVVAVRTVAAAKAKAARGETDPDGRVHLKAAEIGDDYRKAPAEGESWAPANHDGRPVLVPRQQVKAAAKRLRADGLLPVDFAPVRGTRANGRAYDDHELVMPAPATMADFLSQLATYAPAEPKARKPYTRQEPCPACGEVHPRRRDVICTGCGALIESTIIDVPPANDPAATEEQRADLERTFTKNVKVEPERREAPRVPVLLGVHKFCEGSSQHSVDDDTSRFPPEFWTVRAEELGRIDAAARARYSSPPVSRVISPASGAD